MVSVYHAVPNVEHRMDENTGNTVHLNPEYLRDMERLMQNRPMRSTRPNAAKTTRGVKYRPTSPFQRLTTAAVVTTPQTIYCMLFGRSLFHRSARRKQ
jgi:hypothetical protein